MTAPRCYDPTSKTLTVKSRWWLASTLNRLPGTCWMHLVSWALGSRPLVDLSGNQDDIRADGICKMASPDGRCYCGKRQVAKL